MSTHSPRELPGRDEIRAIEGIDASGREAGDRRRDDPIGGCVPERRRQRASVDGVVDGTPQPDAPEERTIRVEDDVVEERSRVEEVLLSPGSSGCAPRTGTMCEHLAGIEERRGVVEILRKKIDCSRVRQRDRSRRRHVVRVHDSRCASWPASAVVGISQQDRAAALNRGHVIRAGGSRRSRRVALRRDRAGNGAERGHRDPGEEVPCRLDERDGERVPSDGEAGDVVSRASPVRGLADDARDESRPGGKTVVRRELTLDRTTKRFGRHRLVRRGREAEARPDTERVGAPGARDRRHGGRDLGLEPRSVRSRRVGVVEEIRTGGIEELLVGEPEVQGIAAAVIGVLGRRGDAKFLPADRRKR